MSANKNNKTLIPNIIAIILAVVAVVCFYVTNNMEGFEIANANLAILLGVAGAVVAVIGTICSMALGSQNILTSIVRLAAVVLLMGLFAFLILDRAAIAANLFSWDHANTAGWNALYVSIASAAAQLIAVIMLCVTAFMDNRK